MSAPTYTVTEGNAQGSPGWFVVRMDGEPIYESSDKKECERRAINRNITAHAFAMLALLVESSALYWEVRGRWTTILTLEDDGRISSEGCGDDVRTISEPKTVRCDQCRRRHPNPDWLES